MMLMGVLGSGSRDGNTEVYWFSMVVVVVVSLLVLVVETIVDCRRREEVCGGNMEWEWLAEKW